MFQKKYSNFLNNLEFCYIYASIAHIFINSTQILLDRFIRSINFENPKYNEQSLAKSTLDSKYVLVIKKLVLSLVYVIKF